MDRREFLEAIGGIPALIPGLSLLPGLGALAEAVHAQAQTPGKLRRNYSGYKTAVDEFLSSPHTKRSA